MQKQKILIAVVALLIGGIAFATIQQYKTLSDSEEKMQDKSVLSTTTHTTSSSLTSITTTTTQKNEKQEALPSTTIIEQGPKTLPSFTKDTLSKHNGTNPSLPIYIAFEGNVYDVTAGKNFYEPGGAYDFLAGTDGTELLHIAGGEIIKKKYPIVGIYRTE